MDFSAAFTYPFKSIAKVASFVLVFTIATVVFLAMILNSFNWFGFLEAVQYSLAYELDFIPFYETPGAMFIPGVIGLLLVVLGQGLWLSGYSIRVIRHIMDGYEKLPNSQVGQDMLKGFYLFLATLVYGGVFFVFFAIVGIVMGVTAGPRGAGGLSGLVFCSGFLFAIPFIFLMGWAYIIGMARYAVDDNLRTLFQLDTNLGIARANVKASLSLNGFQFLLGFSYWFFSQVINNGLQLTMSPFMDNRAGETMMLLGFVILIIVSTALNIVQQFSNMHLIAQYAYKIGIYDTTPDDEFKNF